MLLYEPNAVLGARSWSHFFYQCIFLRIKENMSQGPSVKSLKIMVHSKPQQVVIGHQDLENYVHVETCMKIFMICIT